MKPCEKPKPTGDVDDLIFAEVEYQISRRIKF